MEKRQGSVGVVQAKKFDFDSLSLESGEVISPVRIAYETYGRLNKDRSNAILICHALSGDAHAAGKHRKNSRKKGWYDIAIGPKKTFDTNKYFVICSNVLGGCKGSTGPSSIDPKTAKPYGTEFPLITISDIVSAQKKLVEHLGIKKLFAVVGGSMGGMQALQWSINYPDSVGSVIAVATCAKQYPMGIAFNEVGRRAIMDDPDWQGGNYYGKTPPRNGLSTARKIAHITYLSQETLQRKFGRDRKNSKKNGKFGAKYQVESYLDYQGESFVRRFDANSYLYITRAIDDFDLTEGGKKTLAEAFKDVKARFLLVSFTSDWLYPPNHVQEIFHGLAEEGVRATYKELNLPYGHDGFLVYNNTLGNVLLDFLESNNR